MSGQPSRVERYGNVIRIPPGPGRLILSTDIHGNLEDFRRVAQAFERWLDKTDAYLLYTGDLIHGPCYEKSGWPEHLGDYYPDQSPRVIDELVNLQRKYKGRVFSLIGNHEHSHIGGPHTRKFHKEPSETAYLERTIGPEKTEEFHALFRTFPLCAVVGKGVVVTHGAPRVLEASFAEICAVEYGGHDEKTIPQMLEVPILGELFWTRAAGSLVVRRFMKRMELGDQANHVVVYGHDPVRRGWAREGMEQLCFSTSFACKNARKVYLDLDLDREYRSVDDLKLGRDVRWLYPELSTARKKKASV
ncbi:MAG: metallophosphoesterase [Planctomycetota bacterium]